MDEIEKGKLKVLIKMILIMKYPCEVTARQMSDFINSYEWGFRTPITPRLISKLLLVELKKHDKHFMDNINQRKQFNYNLYSLSSLED